MTIERVEKEYEEAMKLGCYTFAETLLTVADRQAKEFNERMNNGKEDVVVGQSEKADN